MIDTPVFPSIFHENGSYLGIGHRDWFATFAPPVPDAYRVKHATLSGLEIIVQWRYEYADRMMKQREK